VVSTNFSSTATSRRYVALLTVALAGLWLVHSAHAVAAITWMNVYEPKDVRTLRDLIPFIHNLRVPIPPVIAAAEVLSWQWTGSTALVTDYGYRIALVGSYLLAVSLTPPAGYRWLIATLTSIVFLAATVEIHPGNPQVYDAVLPCLVLIVVASLAHATRSRLWLAGVAGLALALADLTRPFVVLFLPLLLIGGCAYLMRVGRAAAMVFALPVLAIGGVWHLHYYVRFGSLVASNHRGFNLQRAWRTPMPVLEPEAPPLAEGRWSNLNTDIHTRNSAAVESAVVAALRAEPSRIIFTGRRLLGVYFSPPTNVYTHRPSARWLWFYQVLAGAALGWMLLNAAALAILCWREPLRWTEPISLLIVATISIYAAHALGDRGEQARFVISWLPMLASWPTVSRAPAA
jgi:hypothetical protein